MMPPSQLPVADTAPMPTTRQPGSAQGAVLLLGSSLTVMGAVMVAPLVPQLMAHFGPTTPAVEVLVPLVVTGPALAIALCAPLAGWLADRVGRKRLLLLATLAYALLGALPFLLNDLRHLVAARLLFGVAEAAVMTCCTTLIADYWQGEARLRYVNRQVVTIGLVGALFFVVGGALGEQGWRLAFLLYLLPLLLLPGMWRVLWEPQRSDHGPAAPGQALTRPGVLAVGYLLVWFGMVLSLVVAVQGPRVLMALGITSSTLMGMAAGLGLLASLLGSLLWPWVRRALGIAAGNALLLALLALGLWLLVRAEDYPDVLVAATVHGIGAGLLVPNTMAPVMNALSAAARARGLGGFTACLYLGQFASPLVVAALMAFSGTLHGALQWLALAAALLAAVWGVVAWCLRPGVGSPD